MLLSDFVIALLREWQKGDAPVNIRIGDKYYDIKNFEFDTEIYEYMLEIEGESDYESRGEPKIL